MNPGGIIALSIFFGIIFFLVIRELLCWYFKINERLKVMEDILAELKKNNPPDNKPEQTKKTNTLKENSEDTKVPENAKEDPYWNKNIGVI